MKAADIHANLAHLSRELVDLLRDYQTANLERVRCEQAYKTAYARAYLTAEGSVEERKQTAVLATVEAAQSAELAEAVWDNTRTALRVLGQRLDAGRTIASTVRAEAIASGVGT